MIASELQGKSANIRRKLLDGYSDSQLVQGIGIQSVGLAKMNTMVPYHFFVIWMLSLLSMATHNATLLALVHDYRRDWVVRWLRQFLMFVNLALSCVCGIFILQAVAKGLDDQTLPIACVWEVGGNGAPSNAGLSYVGTIVVIVGNCAVFALATWYLHSARQRFFKIIQGTGIFLMAAVAIGAAVRIILLSQAFGNPSVELDDQGEKEWIFGQLLSMLLLVLPLVSVVEIYRGEMTLTSTVNEQRVRVPDNEMQTFLK
ncbi:uncharacterized protein J7T54_000674 [Emericellopsis cladophorae]|uniref:Uncharacterized protein n=1 Tax=Emericellopsis cladophorae TaxID=2686198 RepID=A0A9Q0BF68_9HYPO|nr:uncharacterized protein J7T54_000674 [Emericellopsis cladophorae]KAI6783172.1 hypothetical protein J7T54_000674 [Emericellopsis cladophorae]